jgi:1-acyl-sn-glycerol-3-phosphate acyltransferase
MWTDGLTPLRILVRGLLLLLLVIGLLPTLACISPVGRAIKAGGVTLDEFMLKLWSGSLCRVFGVRVRVTGKPPTGPVLIVANHISWLDIALLHSTAAMGFVGKAEIDTWPALGLLARAGDTIFHERGSHDSSSDVSLALIERLKAGRRVAIFPEGGIKPGEAIGVFHARLFKAAVEADCPVQPVMIRYLRDGRRDTEMTFINNENMPVNVLRLLGKPACDADIRFLEPLAAGGRPRRVLAQLARSVVVGAYEEGI